MTLQVTSLRLIWEIRQQIKMYCVWSWYRNKPSSVVKFFVQRCLLGAEKWTTRLIGGLFEILSYCMFVFEMLSCFCVWRHTRYPYSEENKKAAASTNFCCIQSLGLLLFIIVEIKNKLDKKQMFKLDNIVHLTFSVPEYRIPRPTKPNPDCLYKF